MKSNKNGFTLVELLAVIVILAIILVIAVPKVMSVIEDAKKATLESTAKMIASSAEKQKVQNTVLGKEDAITCDSVAKINKLDYENCSIEFDGNTAKVTINGKNKFEGLNVCSGTKTNAVAQKEGCIVSALTVNLDGGTDNNTQYKEKYDAGSTVTLTVPTKEYYEFKEWIIVSGTDASVEGNTLIIGKTDTEVKAVWEDLRTYVDFKVTSSNRSKIGYTGEDGEELVIPATFYDEEKGSWYKVTSIGAGAFKNCSQLTSVTIPDGVTTIGTSISSTGAFEDCTSLTSVSIPDSVTSIGRYTFSGCEKLPYITIPDSVTYIGSSAFSDCKRLTSITIPDGITSIDNYTFFKCSSLTNVIIPDGVTTIGEKAFNLCSSLTSVTIPDSVTSIDMYAFYNCTKLNEFIVGSNNAFYSSIDGVLFDKNQTKLIKYPSGKPNAIYNIPDSVTSIDSHAFHESRSLTDVTIPDGVTSIGNGAFHLCTNLTNVSIPDSVTSIGEQAFNMCSSLTSVIIPDGVTSINSGTFGYCRKLTSVGIPDSVTSIGSYSFDSCSGLTDVYYTGTEDQWNNISIGTSNTYLTDATIYYETTS